MRRNFVVPLVIVLVLASAGASFLFHQGNEGFPDLAPGVYAGAFRLKEEDPSAPLFIEVLSNGSEIIASVGDGAGAGQRRTIERTASGVQGPLTIAGVQRELHFVGHAEEDGVYEGQVRDALLGSQGSWRLQKIEVPSLSVGMRDELATWVSAWDALQTVEKKIEEMTRAFEAGEKRIALVQGPKASDSAPSRAAARESGQGGESREAIASHNEALRRKLEALLRDVDVSRRVSAEGRLVALSRESIQREGRWIEQVLKLTAPALPGSFEDSYDNAQRVKSLLDQIAHERGIMRGLLEGGRDEKTPGERAQEEEFYSGLQ